MPRITSKKGVAILTHWNLIACLSAVRESAVPAL